MKSCLTMQLGFAPVGLVARGGYLLIASPTLDAKDLPGLIALAKRQPGQLVYASTGSGSVANVGMELLKQTTGTDLLHVPYKTGSASTTDLIAGRVHVKLEPVASALPLVRAGKVKALAVTTPKRLAQLPEVATVGETLPGYEISGWHGILVPLRTPAEIVQRLSRSFAPCSNWPRFGSGSSIWAWRLRSLPRRKWQRSSGANQPSGRG